MQGSVAILGLLAAVLAGLLASPDDAEALARCLRECDASSGTDAETCRLQCRQRAERGEAPIEQWKRVELKGGSPDPNVEGGSTTTTVRRGPDGTTTTIERTDRSGRTTVTQHAGTERTPVEGTGRVPFSIAARLQAWCYLGCSSRPSFAARASCRTQCPRVGDVSRAAVEPATRSQPEPSKADPAACRSACTTRAQRCKDACPTRASDRTTCALQCEEGERACSKKC